MILCQTNNIWLAKYRNQSNNTNGSIHVGGIIFRFWALHTKIVFVFIICEWNLIWWRTQSETHGSRFSICVRFYVQFSTVFRSACHQFNLNGEFMIFVMCMQFRYNKIHLQYRVRLVNLWQWKTIAVVGGDDAAAIAVETTDNGCRIQSTIIVVLYFAIKAMQAAVASASHTHTHTQCLKYRIVTHLSHHYSRTVYRLDY